MTDIIFSFRKAVLLAAACLLAVSCGGPMRSPSAEVEADFGIDGGRPSYSVHFHGTEVLATSAMGLVLDGDTLGRASVIKGKKSCTVSDSVREYEYMMEDGGKHYTVQFRLSDDAVAFRYVIDRESCHVDGELSSFAVHPGTPVWFFERPNDWKLKSYAGEWTKTVSDSLWCVSPTGPVQGAVLLYELPEGRYMAMAEAALYRYSGMRYRAMPDASLVADFTEGEEGFDIAADPRTGLLTTPWRVVMLADDLDELVNCTMVPDLNPDPDPMLFPEGSEDWILPGRCVWSWWSDPDGFMTPELERRFIDAAQTLGYEYTLLDEGWEAWPAKWDTLASMCSYAADRNVRVLAWKDSKDICDPEGDYRTMTLFLDSLRASGVSGVKVDFMNSEAAWAISFDERLLQKCAERQMVVDFHGCQKPSGESRTYPNELTREGVRGLELNRMNQPVPAGHDVALVFTRGILGSMDYTPVGFSRPANTTFAHQTATAFAFTSPLTVIAEHVDTLLASAAVAPALPLLKSLPSVWDETRILPGSSIPELALMARRSGEEWYLVALGGMEAQDIDVQLDFLGAGDWDYYGVCDPSDGEDSRHRMLPLSGAVASGDSMHLSLLSEGGAVIRFSPRRAADAYALIPAPRCCHVEGTATYRLRPAKVDRHFVATHGADEYRLVVRKGRAVMGGNLFWARQTLDQLTDSDGCVPDAEIHDWAAYPVRGFMHDTGRNYQPLSMLKETIDLMARYKLNFFHWHLTDNPAWRIECRCHPELNDPQYQRRGRDEGKYYTYDEIRELISYAAERGVSVMPEIDMPGHSTYFRTTYGFGMDSEEGRQILSDCLEEFFSEIPASLCPYFHVGSDEIHIADPQGFAEWIQGLVRSYGRIPVAWDPGLPTMPYTIRQGWRENVGTGVDDSRYVDSFVGYLNYFDPEMFAMRAFQHKAAAQDVPDTAKALGGILCLWNDVRVDKKENISLHNGMIPGMMAFSERFWRGGSGHAASNESLYPDPDTRQGLALAGMERRMTAHRDRYYTPSTMRWNASASLSWDVTIDGRQLKAWGGAINLEALCRANGIEVGDAEQAVAQTVLTVSRDIVMKAWVGFDIPARSDRISTGIGEQGRWENDGRIFLNGEELMPPVAWQEPGAYNYHFHTWHKPEEEQPYTDEQLYWMRPAVTLHLRRGDNIIRIENPHTFDGQKWAFAFIPLDSEDIL